MSNDYGDILDQFRSKGWFDKQRALIASFAERIDGAAVSSAAAHFMVARQFKRISVRRSDDFEPVATLVAEHASGMGSSAVVERTQSLALALSRLPGSRGRPISAASKFLWCAAPESAVIYDQWAARQLRRRGYRVPARDYAKYYEAWSEEFSKERSAIAASLASRGLSDPWLEGKIFDFALYDLGRRTNVE